MARITIVATGGTRAPTLLDLADRFLQDRHEVRLIASRTALRFLLSHMVRRPRKLPRFIRHFRPYFLEFLAYFKERPKAVPHISEGKWCDVLVMAPATCNSVGKLVSGISDNYPLLVVRALPRTKRVIVVPSMNPEMWYDPHFQRNVDLLNSTDKYRVLCPSRGQMLSGDFGFGAQVPLEDIVTETYRTLGILDKDVEAFLRVQPGRTVPWEDEKRSTADGQESTVVLIDEDTAVREEVARSLLREYHEFKVHQFSDPGGALAWMWTHPASLIFTELDFSHGATGFDLITEFRRPGHEAVHLIATSTRDRREIGAERLAAQEVLYVPKPLNVPFAVGMIAGCLRGAPRRRTPMAQRELAAGEILFHEGERGTEIYIVRSGLLRVLKKRGDRVVVLGTIGSRGIVGEMAFFGQTIRSATVEASEPTDLIELDLANFRSYLESQPAWLRVMIDSLVNHLRQADERLIAHGEKEPDA